MRIAIIDNHDSFTYNLSHLVKQLGAEVTVVSVDDAEPQTLQRYDRLILSPGPGLPHEVPRLSEIIRLYQTRKPILGVCLGHQAIGEFFGAHLTHLPHVFHGIAADCIPLPDEPLFQGLGSRFAVGRYHSWVVDDGGFPSVLQVTATSGDGLIMALRHRMHPVCGIQFHPESVLTPQGLQIMDNWLSL